LRSLRGIAPATRLRNNSCVTVVRMWRYSSCCPRPAGDAGEGWTPMLPSDAFERVLKEEGANPTSTFKGGGLRIAVTMARHYG